ncbi:MAG: SlyX family protein [Planctomycetaceae bacterium]
MMAEAHPLETRLIALESLCLHLQNDLETLNGVILEQNRQIDRLKQLVTRVDDRLSQFAVEEETRDPQAERPPHY